MDILLSHLVGLWIRISGTTDTGMSHDNDNMANIVHLDCIHTIRAYFCNSLFDSACVQKLHTLLLNLKGAVTMNCPLNPLNVHDIGGFGTAWDYHVL